MKKKPKILVVGSFVMDLIVTSKRFPNSGETVLGIGYQTAPGGKGANQAVQAARLGADVTMVGKVGCDAFGDALLDSARASGVNVSHVLRAEDAPSAVGNVQLELGDGKCANRIIVVPGANMTITPEEVAFLEDEIAQYDMVLLQLEIPMEINCLAARFAAKAKVPVMLNCAPIASMPQELLKNVTYLSPNEHEAQWLTKIEIKDDTSIRTAMDVLREMGVQRALITLGSRGAVYAAGDGVLLSPAISGLAVMDTTAAGDSFVGAFCTAAALGVPAEKALSFANHTAALTVCRMGAQPSLPTIDEVLALMEAQGKDTAIFSPLKNKRGALSCPVLTYSK